MVTYSFKSIQSINMYIYAIFINDNMEFRMKQG